MPEAQPNHIIRRWRFIQWPFIGSLASIAFLLGLSGFKHLPHETPMSCTDHDYQSANN